MTVPAESEQALALPRRRARGRTAAAHLVLALAGVLLLLTTFAVWVDRVALNTDVFVDTSSELIEDDAIRRAVAERIVDEIYASVDVQAAVEEQLPKDAKRASGPVAAAARQFAPDVLDRALRQRAFQRLWAAALRRSHAELVDVLEGGSAHVSTEGGVVTLDLRALALESAERFGVRAQIEERFPVDGGQIEILRSDELDTAQDGFHVLKTLAWLLPVLTLLAFGAALAIAIDRRRAIRSTGVTIVLVGIVGLVVANLSGNYIVDSLVEERDARPAANDAWDILTELMRSSLRWLVVIGVLFVAAAWLAGPGRRALGARRFLAPGLVNRIWAYSALGVVTVALLLTGPVGDFSRFLTVAVLAALGVVWIEVTRVQALREFPGASGAVLAGEARTRVAGWWEARRRLPEVRLPRREPAPGQGVDVTSRLATLADLHARGALTDAEYAAAKTRVLAGE